jgi:hypothetical protein
VTARPGRRRTARLAAVAATIAATVGLAATAGAASFDDPIGDVGIAPPDATLTGLDIAGVDVTNTKGIQPSVTFRVALAGSPVFPPHSLVAVLLDTDKNTSTGEDGTDSVVIFEVGLTGAQSLAVGHFDPVARAIGYFSTHGTATYADGTLTVSIPRSELDNTRGFTFAVLTVVAVSGSHAASAADVAPDVAQSTYDLAGLPPLLVFQRPVGEPTRPHAGDRFTVTSAVTREDSGELVRRGTVTCVAHVGRTQITGTGRLTGAGARCAMSMPRSTRGKTLRGSLRIRAAGSTAARGFVFRVT